MHIIDTERVLSYRALVGARGDNTTQLQSYDDDAYANNVDVSNRSLESIIEEFKTIRNYELVSKRQKNKVSLKQALKIIQLHRRSIRFYNDWHCKHHFNVLKGRCEVQMLL